MSEAKREQAKLVLKRKLFHMLFVSFMLVPFLVELKVGDYVVSYVQYFSILLGFAVVVNVTVVRMPEIRDEIIRQSRLFRKQFTEIMAASKPTRGMAELIEKFNEHLTKFEDMLIREISLIERDYEKRGGYIGMVAGAASVLIVASFLPEFLLPSILTLFTIDVVSAIVGAVFGRVFLPYSTSTLEGCIFGALSFLPVALGYMDLLTAVFVSLALAFVEAYSIEDNFFLPISCALLMCAISLFK